MKNSGGNKKKKALSYKTVGLVFIAILIMAVFAFSGLGQSAFVNVQKWLADNEPLGSKTKTNNKIGDQDDGTYKLSLSVIGDAERKPTRVNVIVIVDRSNSMNFDSGTNETTYTPTTSYGDNQYGEVNGEYVPLKRDYLYTEFTGTPDNFTEYYGVDDNGHFRIYYNNGTWYRTRSGRRPPYTYSNPYTGKKYTRSQYQTTYYLEDGTIYTGTRYSKQDANKTRLEATKDAVNNLATSLLSNNGKDGNPDDMVEMALVTFGSTASTTNFGTNTNRVYKTTSSDTFTNAVNSISVPGDSYGGTNWEDALEEANGVNFGDSNPTYVIFFSDGAPTFRNSKNGHNDQYSYYGTTYSFYGDGDENKTNMDRAYETSTDEAAALATKVGVNNFFTIFAFGSDYGKTYMENLTNAAGSPAGNNYSASNTAGLQEAFADVLSRIEMAGISNVDIVDGTTNKVATSSGVSSLLTVDTSSFQYWRTKEGVRTEWKSTDNPAAPAASLDPTTGEVKWDLSSLGLLENDVTYEVTFDVYPSQETYDLIAEIKNIKDLTERRNYYNGLDANIKKYLKPTDNTYTNFTLETNTVKDNGESTATITYTDTREDDPQPHTYTYTNPAPVATDASELDVEKVWLNQFDKEFVPRNLGIKMDLIKDTNNTGQSLILTSENTTPWTDTTAIATGLMRVITDSDGNKTVKVLDSGHDYTLSEATIFDIDKCDASDPNVDLTAATCKPSNYKGYQWELLKETVHPMIINGTLTTLIEVKMNEIPSGMETKEVYEYNGHTFYKFNGKVYYDKVVPTAGTNQTNAQLNAYNLRKSNFNFTKTVVGDPVGGELFNFTFKINDTNIDESEISSITDPTIIMNNYSVWFSVCDPAKLAAVGHSCEDPNTDTFRIEDYLEKDITTSATKEIKDGVVTGYYYANDNSNITLSIKDGWNVRVINLGTGSTYTVTESAPTTPFGLTAINGDVTVSVPELPANALYVSDGVYNVNGVEYRRMTTTDAAGSTITVYQYTYKPTKDEQNRTITGTLVAPNNVYSVEFVNTYPKTHLTVNKDWHVAEDAKKAVEVTLYRKVENGTEQKVTQTGLTNPATLNAANNWTYSFKDLDVYDANDKVYEYYVKESTISGGKYVTTYTGTEDIVVSATNIPTGTESIAVNVIIGTETQTVTLTKANSWKSTITGVNYINDDGTPKYVSVQSDSNATINYVLTNRVNNITNEEKTDVEVTKTWKDGPDGSSTDQDGIRPNDITLTLVGTIKEEVEGKLVDKQVSTTTKVVSKEDNWYWKWENLPKYYAVTTTDEATGETTTTYQLITYAVTETPVDGYTASQTPNTQYGITNTHTPFTSTVTIKKDWTDGGNQDGIRPSEITLVLKNNNGLIIKDGEKDYITLKASNDWTYTTTLPRRATGTDLVYTVSDVKIDGVVISEIGAVTQDYTATIATPSASTTTGTNSNQTITLNVTNTHTPSVIPVSGRKIWSDFDDQDGIRPASVTVKLMAKEYDVDGTTVLNSQIDTGRTITLPQNGSWDYNFGNMPEYKAGAEGHKLEYYVVETTNISGYTSTSVGYNVDNAHTPATTYKTGEKTWDDNNNQDGKRPSSITVILTGKIPQKDESGNVMHDNDGNIIYNPTPVYTATQTVTPDKDGKWTYRFDNIPKYADHGTEIVYTTTDIVDGYSATNNSMNITNTLIPETVDVQGEKIWDDTNNQDGLRPTTSITVTLVGKAPQKDTSGNIIVDEDGKIVYKTVHTETQTVTPDEDGKWAYEFKGLSKNTNIGTETETDIREIIYEVTDNVPGYEATSEGHNVRNYHKPTTIDVSGTKVWNDGSNQDGKRPTTVTIELTGTIKLPDSETGELKDTTVVNETVDITVANAVNGDTDKWAYIFEGVPEFQQGQRVDYTVAEVNNLPKGYTSVVDATDKRTITNTYNPGKVDVEGYKIWDDANNQDGKRPKGDQFISITLTGTVTYETESGIVSHQTMTETKQVTENSKVQIKENGVMVEHLWGWSWKELPEYYQGHEITYTISETQVTGYERPVVDGYKVTNKHTPEVVSVEGKKTWKDGPDGSSTNQDGLRPDSLRITLHAVVEYKDSATGKDVSYTTSDDGDYKEVTAADNWSWSWTDLPKYNNGHLITYSVEEEEVTYYTGAEDPENDNSFINTHDPFKSTVTIKKNWEDANNQDGLRPDEITLVLKDNNGLIIKDGEKDYITLKASNNWTYTATLPRRATGADLVYTVSDVKIDDIVISEIGPVTQDYTARIADPIPSTEAGTNSDQTIALNITNEHEPSTVPVAGIKIWDDDSNRDRVRPQSIYITVTGKVSYTDEETGQEVKDEVVSTDTKEVTAADAVKDNSNHWAYSWPSLPEFNNGHKITYTITETDKDGNEITNLPNYKAPEYDGYNVTNTHEISKTSINGKKVWADDSNRDVMRPASVTVTLYADGVEKDHKSVNVTTAINDNEWSFTFDNLPANNNGQPIVYTVREKDPTQFNDKENDVPTGYTQTVSGTTITNTHTPEPTSLPITKIWDDEDDRDGKRPNSITVYVYDEDDQTTPVIPAVTVSVEDKNVNPWNYTITDPGLKKYKNVEGVKTPITYVIKEEQVDGYLKSSVSGTTITNKRDVEKMNIPVTKQWVDNENSEKHRPQTITIKLFADGVDTGKTITLPTEDGKWTSTFTDLQKYKNHGTETINYTVQEVIEEGSDLKEYYDVSYPDTKPTEGKVVVNTIKDLKKNIPVAKIWDDQNNRDNARPTTITYTLTGTVPGKEEGSDPEEVVTRTLTLTRENNLDPEDPNRWEGEFEDVPIFHEGTWITYTVNEKEVEGYTPISNETINGVVTIKNNHQLTTVDVTATKKWEDNNDNDGKRPESVQITLYADGVEQETKTATAESNWQVKFEGLVKFAEGEVGRPIVYTVREKDAEMYGDDVTNVPAGYTQDVSGTTITNTHEAVTISYKVTKDWKDFENNDGKRPEFITVRLVGKVGTEVVEERELQVYEINEGFEDEPWTYAFTNLPKYYNKQLIQYTLTEDKVDLYETQTITQVSTQESTTEITNTITNEHDKIPYNENGEITVNKYWIDDNDKYKKRPGSITVNLLAFDEVVATGELSDANGWAYTFRNLPMYMIKDGKVGVEIKYSIEEIAVEDYETEIDGFNIYNTYNGPVPEITPPNTGVMMTKQNNNNVLFEMIISLLATSYTVVVLRKQNEQ